MRGYSFESELIVVAGLLGFAGYFAHYVLRGIGFVGVVPTVTEGGVGVGGEEDGHSGEEGLSGVLPAGTAICLLS